MLSIRNFWYYAIIEIILEFNRWKTNTIDYEQSEIS